MKGNKMIREWLSRMSLILLTIIVITGCSESNSDFSTGIDPDPMTVAASRRLRRYIICRRMNCCMD